MGLHIFMDMYTCSKSKNIWIGKMNINFSKFGYMGHGGMVWVGAFIISMMF